MSEDADGRARGIVKSCGSRRRALQSRPLLVGAEPPGSRALSSPAPPECSQSDAVRCWPASSHFRPKCPVLPEFPGNAAAPGVRSFSANIDRPGRAAPAGLSACGERQYKGQRPRMAMRHPSRAKTPLKFPINLNLALRRPPLKVFLHRSLRPDSGAVPCPVSEGNHLTTSPSCGGGRWASGVVPVSRVRHALRRACRARAGAACKLRRGITPAVSRRGPHAGSPPATEAVSVCHLSL